jgi:hypothetical protein
MLHKTIQKAALMLHKTIQKAALMLHKTIHIAALMHCTSSGVTKCCKELCGAAAAYFKLLGRRAQGGGAGSRGRFTLARAVSFACDALGGDAASTKLATRALP